MSSLVITQFGDPVLRKPARRLSAKEIIGDEVQSLIAAMKRLLIDKKLGVGLAAPQVGESIAVAIIEVQNTALRKVDKPVSMVIINPVITSYSEEVEDMWEGCISSGDGQANLFAKVPRSKSIELEYMDENGKVRKEFFDGFAAHVIQHEVDHLSGILFVDRVQDTKTYMTYQEYKKMKEFL